VPLLRLSGTLGSVRSGHTEDVKSIVCGLSSLVVSVDCCGYKERVHCRWCLWLTTSAAFSGNVAEGTVVSKRRWAQLTTRDIS